VVGAGRILLQRKDFGTSSETACEEAEGEHIICKLGILDAAGSSYIVVVHDNPQLFARPPAIVSQPVNALSFRLFPWLAGRTRLSVYVAPPSAAAQEIASYNLTVFPRATSPGLVLPFIYTTIYTHTVAVYTHTADLDSALPFHASCIHTLLPCSCHTDILLNILILQT
jgi:hypothetical protein